MGVADVGEERNRLKTGIRAGGVQGGFPRPS